MRDKLDDALDDKKGDERRVESLSHTAKDLRHIPSNQVSQKIST
jgi:hypothetical protein